MSNELIHGKWELGIKKKPFVNKNSIDIENFNIDKIIKAPSNYFYADPFIVLYNNLYYVFFENFDYNKGQIAYIILDKSLNIIKESTLINLSIKSHLSYPYIFLDNNIYHSNMIPIFKCIQFPDKWEFVKNLLNESVHCGDNSLIKYNNIYYLFTHNYLEVIPGNKKYYYEIYYSNTLLGKYDKHKIVNSELDKKNEKSTRGAGKIFKLNDMLIRPAQFSDRGINGEGVIFYKIKKLSPEEFNEIPITIINPQQFNYRALHTFSYNEETDIVVIDGRKERQTDGPFTEINLIDWKKNIIETNFYVNHNLLKEVFLVIYQR